MIVQGAHQQQPIFKLSSRPVFSHPLSSHSLSVALDTQGLEIVDLNKLQSRTIQTGHTKRINQVKTYQDLILTCSNDGGVKLWDTRASYQNAATLKRGYEIYSVAMDESRIVTGSVSRVTFWDPKTNKETKSYQESFDGDVTDLALRDNKLYGCGTDGMVACFDPLIEQEQDAAEWTHRIGNPAQSLRLRGNHTVLSTTDHVLIALKEEVQVKKIEINSADEPRHLLWHNFDSQDFQYIAWNINDSVLERWHEKELQEVVKKIDDVDFVEVMGERSIGISGQGGILDLRFQKGKEKMKKVQLQEDEQQQELIKVKYNKINKKKLFNPY